MFVKHLSLTCNLILSFMLSKKVGGRQRKAFRINVWFDLASRKKVAERQCFSATGMSGSGIKLIRINGLRLGPDFFDALLLPCG
jgi:hypothetical protein